MATHPIINTLLAASYPPIQAERQRAFDVLAGKAAAVQKSFDEVRRAHLDTAEAIARINVRVLQDVVTPLALPLVGRLHRAGQGLFAMINVDGTR